MSIVNLSSEPARRPGSAVGTVARAAEQGSLPGTSEPLVGLLTGGWDKPYALGLASALIAQGIPLDFIGSDDIDAPELHGNPLVTFLNLRGDQRADAGFARKVRRVLIYYLRLIGYASMARPRIFHLLWNNKFQFFDRTVLTLYYKVLGKKLVFTAHNVNAGKRDANDSLLNRFSLWVQYHLVDHIFVHTARMKGELVEEFGIPPEKATVIPFGINNTTPITPVTPAEARRHFGINEGEKVLLFFGNIAPYKGLGYLVGALAELARRDPSYRLIIAGRPKNCEQYWNDIQREIDRNVPPGRILQRAEYIRDEEVELFFKAADVLILPYVQIFQSGVLFLGYSFGLPVIVSDVGSLKEDVVPGRTGLVCRASDVADLARAIAEYFSSELFKNLESRRAEIQKYANERYSWATVGETTRRVYSELLKG